MVHRERQNTRIVDLSDAICSARRWSEDTALQVADKIASSLEASKVDWDDENWILVIQELEDASLRVVAMVHLGLALVFCLSSLAEDLKMSVIPEACLIEFASYSGSPEFRLQPDLLGAELGGSKNGWKSAEVDPNAFSAHDLFYLTVH